VRDGHRSAPRRHGKTFEDLWFTLEMMAASGPGEGCCDRDCFVRIAATPGLKEFCEFYQGSHVDQRHLILNMLLSPFVDPGLRARQFIVYQLPLAGSVCRAAFCAFFCVSTGTIKARLDELRDGRVHPAPSRLAGRQGNRAVDEDTRCEVLAFFDRLATRCGERIPSAHIRREWADIVLLPTAFTRRTLFRVYLEWAHERNRARVLRGDDTVDTVSLRTLFRMWHDTPELQHIRVRHRSKMECDTCVELLERRRACNGDAYERATEQLVKHVSAALAALSAYHQLVESARLALATAEPGAAPAFGHATFDYAKALTLPRFTNPPAAFYRMQNAQVKHFAVVNDGTKEFFDYFYREADGGTGADYVVSLLDDFLSRQRPCPSKWIFHADNTASQNRNNAMLWYLCYVASTRRHGITEIEYRFLVPGHTHTRVDAGFGHIATVLKRYNIYSTRQLLEAVRGIKHHDKARLVRADAFKNFGDTLGRWLTKPVGLVKSSAGFRFQATTPWTLHYRVRSADAAVAGAAGDGVAGASRGGEWKQRSLLKPSATCSPPADLPLARLPPPGISVRKQWLLYEQVRPLIPDDEGRDELCPLPTEPRPTNLDRGYDEAIVEDALATGACMGACSTALL
jgi:hypothetical protein